MKNYLTKLLATVALALALTAPALAQTGPATYRVNTINALLQITLYGTSGVAWVGGGAALDDGLGGVFFYDSTSSATTNVYMIYKPVNNNGRWFKHPTAVANQDSAVTVATDTTYAWKLLRAGQTNFFGIGADNNIAYVQTFNGKNLHINNIGNNTILNSTAGSVGIAVEPLDVLHVAKTAAATDTMLNALRLERKVTGGNGASGNGVTIDLYAEDDGGTTRQVGGISGLLESATTGSLRGGLRFSTRNVPNAAALTHEGNFMLGTLTNFGTSAVATLGLANGTAPSTSPADTVQLYSADITAGNAALHVRGEDGTIIAIGDGGILFTGAQTISTTTGALTLSTGAAAGNIALNPHTTGSVTTTGDVELSVAGKGIEIKEGSNARMGTATLSGGTIAVSNTSAATGDRIFIQRVSGTSAEFGHLSYTISNGVSFTINSTDAQDDSVVNWLIIKPTP